MRTAPAVRTKPKASQPDRDGVLPLFVLGLLQPNSSTYPHPTDHLELHETHISWVVLAGEYAYKLKKPVTLGFLDFSTVERRAADCADEVRLNRRLCPDVYLGVVWVGERPGGDWGVGERSAGAEPAVWMRRLPEGGMLPRLLANGTANPLLMSRLAKRLAAFHATAATGPEVDAYGAVGAVRANWEENFAQTAPFVGRALSPQQIQVIGGYVNRFLDEEVDFLQQRVTRGRIRDGHGDLHAASVCVEGGRLQLFDCIEFNARFRCADVAAEVAFLVMDLEHYGRADLAAAFVDAYVRTSGDADIERLLDFYVCYRAYVRGKVLSFRLDQPGLASAEGVAIAAEARAYFDLAWAHAGGLARTVLVVAMGLPASGKTTLARALAEHLGLVHVSSDRVRKELAGLRPDAHRDEPFGQGLYNPSATRRTYAALRRRAARWLRRGRSVVLDATYSRPAERAALRGVATRAGARLVLLVCQADEALLLARLAARRDGEGGESDARPALWPALRQAFVKPTAAEHVTAISTAGSLAQSVACALAAVAGPGAAGGDT